MRAIFFLSPLFFISLSALEISQIITFTGVESLIFRSLAAVLFLGSIHIVLTFANILNISELQNFLIAEYKSLKRFLLQTTVLFSIIFLSLLYVFDILLPSSFTTFHFKLYTYIHIFLATHHSVSQTTGLLLSGIQVPPSQWRNFKRKIHWYKSLVIFLAGVSVVKLFKLTFSMDLILFIFLPPLLLLTINLIKNSYTYSGKNKLILIYSIRFFLWMLMPLSIIASISVLACHGIEYAYLSIIMTKRSEYKKIQHGATLLLLSIGLSLALLSRKSGVPAYFSNDTFAEYWLNIATAFGLSLTYLHYHLDAVIFRLKNHNVRTHLFELYRNSIH